VISVKSLVDHQRLSFSRNYVLRSSLVAGRAHLPHKDAVTETVGLTRKWVFVGWRQLALFRDLPRPDRSYTESQFRVKRVTGRRIVVHLL